MFGLAHLATLVAVGLGALYWWHSFEYKRLALKLAARHCAELDLQLLDYSMVIRGIWPLRGADGRLALRRRYQFEFASTGDRRYQGCLTLVGRRLESIELETYKIPGTD